MKYTKLIATVIVVALLGISMTGLRHIRNLDNQIKFKKIELKDNSIKLELLDKKYDELNENLKKTGSDKAKIEEELKQLQIERDKLSKQLQAKIDSKAKDIAVKASQAVGAPKTAYAAPIGDVEAIVRQAALKYGVNPDYMVRIAKCESGLRPTAVAPNLIAGSHPTGLFQHVAVYWPARAKQYGWPGASIYNAQAQAEVSAQMFKAGGSRLWECK